MAVTLAAAVTAAPAHAAPARTLTAHVDRPSMATIRLARGQILQRDAINVVPHGSFAAAFLTDPASSSGTPVLFKAESRLFGPDGGSVVLGPSTWTVPRTGTYRLVIVTNGRADVRVDVPGTGRSETLRTTGVAVRSLYDDIAKRASSLTPARLRGDVAVEVPILDGRHVVNFYAVAVETSAPAGWGAIAACFRSRTDNACGTEDEPLFGVRPVTPPVILATYGVERREAVRVRYSGWTTPKAVHVAAWSVAIG